MSNNEIGWQQIGFRLEKFQVEGGWLYRCYDTRGVSAPVFVPTPQAPVYTYMPDPALRCGFPY